MATADQLLLGCKSPSCPALGWRCVFYYGSLVVMGAEKGRIVKHIHALKAPTHKKRGTFANILLDKVIQMTTINQCIILSQDRIENFGQQ